MVQQKWGFFAKKIFMSLEFGENKVLLILHKMTNFFKIWIFFGNKILCVYKNAAKFENIFVARLYGGNEKLVDIFSAFFVLFYMHKNFIFCFMHIELDIKKLSKILEFLFQILKNFMRSTMGKKHRKFLYAKSPYI